MYDVSFSLSGSIRQFIYKVFGWMSIALAITAGVAYYIYRSPYLFTKIFSSPMLVFSIFLLQFALVMILSFLILRMSFLTALIAFIAYSIAMGITFSAIFYTYSLNSIVMVFAICSGMFATMALYGYFTKADLTSIGSYARMGLIGLIIALLINLYFQNSTFDYIISLLGVGIFTILTAYDMQRIVALAGELSTQEGSSELQDKFALMGALTLYLDFINLFLMLLRLFGSRRQ